MIPTDDIRLAQRERPRGRPVMFQQWRNLLFLHWSWDPREIQRTLPPGLTVDVFEGNAWLGVVPFFMRGVRPAWCPPVPGVSYFLELNVRTYVFDRQGRPGVWFYSLDANQWLAVELARAWFHLPYEHADMFARPLASGLTDYCLQRRGGPPRSRYQYGPAGHVAEAAPGTLEFFLVERYRLFSFGRDAGQLFSGRVFHAPYRISPAELTSWDDGPLRCDGFASPSRSPDHVLFSSGLDVDVFALETVESAD